MNRNYISNCTGNDPILKECAYYETSLLIKTTVLAGRCNLLPANVKEDSELIYDAAVCTAKI